MWEVYRFTFPNGKVYIGCTGQGIKVRCKPNNYTPSMPVSEAFKTFSTWKLEVLSRWSTMEEGHAAEIAAIAAHDSTNPEKGYNATKGGLGSLGFLHTDEWKAENSRRMKGRKLSPEQIEKQRMKMLGRKRPDLAEQNNGFYGKKHDAKTLARLSEVGRTKKFTDEIRRHMSEGHKGVNKTAVICIETGKRYETLRAASQDTGINYSCISAVARGHGYTAGGYHWKLAV